MTEPAPQQVRALLTWVTLGDSAAATSLMDRLVPWLDGTYLRYSGADLPTCWAWHPDVVEELWWLHNAWLDAYTGDHASWVSVGDWHEKHRPGVVARIGQLRCRIRAHVTEADPTHPRLYVPLADAIPRISASWGTPEHQDWPSPATAPSEADQAASNAYFDAKQARVDAQQR